MALSIFDEKSKPPNDQELLDVLGENSVLWNNLKEHVFIEYPEAKDEWNYSGKKYGWSFRLKDKKRVIIYMTPQSNFFRVGIVFGSNATKEALDGNISQEIKDIISSTKVYAEGRGFRIDVTNLEICEDIKKLVNIKLKN